MSRFYPRHPRGWRQTSFGLAAPTPLFLSTPPSRVATWRYNLFADRDSGFYPRHPRGWRLQNRVVETLNAYVSIHATLAGGDSGSSQRTYRQKEFLSTPPSRVATAGTQQTIDMLTKFLSTPPSRVATGFPQPPSASGLSFYPRHPRGWRRHGAGRTVDGAGFLSTPPSRVATADAKKVIDEGVFLSTPPSRVATGEPKPKVLALNQFLSTPPSRVAPAEVTTTMYKFIVSIHATLAGGDPARCGTTCPA